MIVDMRAERQDRSDMPNAEEDMLDYAPVTPADETPAAVPPSLSPWLEENGAPIEEAPLSRWPLILAILVSVLWVGVVLAWGIMASAPHSPATLAPLVTLALAGPMLVAILWLVGQRSSRAEQRRFALTARDMRNEAAALERAVAAIGQALAANRSELSAQAIALSEMAQAAETRFNAIARDLADDIQMVEAHGRTLADIAGTSQASMTKLLHALPLAAEEVGEASDRMAEAARSAESHAASLDAQLVALGRRGQDADTIASGAALRLATHIEQMEATSRTASEHLESVTANVATTIDAMLDRTAEAIDQSRKGLAAQGEAMLAMVAANQAALDSAARDSAEALAERLTTVDGAVARLAAELEAQRIAGETMIDTLDTELERVETRIAVLHSQGTEKSQMLAASISALGGSADAMTGALEAGETMANRVIGTTETLLIALDAAAREIDETLPEALSRLDQRMQASHEVVVETKPELLALVAAAESTHEAIEAIAEVIAEQRHTLETLSGSLIETLSTGRAKADALGMMVEETIERSHQFADEAAPKLVDALLRVRETAATAAERARETLAEVIPQAASALELASAEAMRRATGDTVERQVHAIVDATQNAVEAATRATERLARQADLIIEKTTIVESRIEEARSEREEADRDNFARRASLLVESLNSASIDITKIYAPEVTDSAWAAYLKGDRGVFTRRAVRILDSHQARGIADLYDEDPKFRDHVNRYIHDFEAMLRGVLAQRDGSPLGVTLLSSDMGKLYVALAQAIERLR
ncbi:MULTISPECIES: hypothetical protein [Sphingomonas]|jgi:hypothetical protein|nr:MULTISPECIES: hypothetical protein [Sphingomonas]MBB4048372.1 hypothetical protein [Sphingomonas zeae]MDK8186258.1 hypothetical protein [Sphingomonas zeae]MDK8215780.1 hypothetical protein [Sphingomonas sp. UMB7805-LC452B]